MDSIAPPLSIEALRVEVDAGAIDTVVVGIADMQGRLQGKRFHARHFLDEVLAHGTEGCNYPLAVDVEMNTVEGYAMSSWSAGYGDFVLLYAPNVNSYKRYQPGSLTGYRAGTSTRTSPWPAWWPARFTGSSTT